MCNESLGRHSARYGWESYVRDYVSAGYVPADRSLGLMRSGLVMEGSMSEIRYFPQQQERVETGPIAFGNDWPGVFIRGDNALGYAMAIEEVLWNIEKSKADMFFAAVNLRELKRTLRSCHL